MEVKEKGCLYKRHNGAADILNVTNIRNWHFGNMGGHAKKLYSLQIEQSKLLYFYPKRCIQYNLTVNQYFKAEYQWYSNLNLINSSCLNNYNSYIPWLKSFLAFILILHKSMYLFTSSKSTLRCLTFYYHVKVYI